MKKRFLLILIGICFLSLFINLYKKDSSPPCFNADEAAFGYNAYSLLKTGKDEYGTLLPLRLKSFGDYKMPLYSYLSIPFIAIGGLNEFSTRALNTFIAFLFPIVIYLLSQKLFQNKKISLVASLLFALAPGIQTIGRQAHEAYLTTFFIFLSIWLFVRNTDKPNMQSGFLFLLSLVPLSFGYQFSRLWILFFFVFTLYFVFRKKLSFMFLLAFLITFFLLLLPDVIVKPARVNNLLFFNNIGLGLQTAELRSEGGTRLLYNKATVGLKNFLFSHFAYYSPQFLVSQGDENLRFSYPGISPITLTEYLLLFIGLFYLFKDAQKWRYFLVICLLMSPLAASLSWAGNSLTRSLPLIPFIIICSAYGIIRLYKSVPKKYQFVFIVSVSICYIFFNFYSWDFYFNHYPKRARTIRAWQCGNREIVNYIKDNYSNTDLFFITSKSGEPYIFFLFYLNYPPKQYQKQAVLSAPDESGFGQVEKIDKINFQFIYMKNRPKTVYIGYPDDFNDIPNAKQETKKITIGTEEIFWILKNK